MEGNLDTLDWYLTSYQILIKSVIWLEKYELFKYFNRKVMTQKLKVCFVDLKVMGMGNDTLWYFLFLLQYLEWDHPILSLCKTSGSRDRAIFTPGL